MHPKGYTDHAELEITMQFPEDSPVGMAWKMPRDLQSMPGILPAISAGTVLEEEKCRFQDAVQNGDVNKQFQVFVQNFEAVEQRVSHDVIGKRLPDIFLGKGRGKIVPVKTVKLSAMRDASCVTDRLLVLKRQKAVNLLLELAHHCCDAQRPVLAARHRVWNKLRKMPGFPHGFPPWVSPMVIG